MRKRGIIIFAVAAAMLLPSALLAASAVNHSPPKKANFYLRWTISDSEARELARWDVVTLDMEVQSTNPGAIRLMRRLNPNIKILAYVTASEIRSDAAELGNAAPLRRDLKAAIPDYWYVADAAGNRRSFWSGTFIVNVTDRAAMSNGERWNDFLPRFVRDKIWSMGLWDGVMYDNSWENISFFAGGSVDLDRNGQNENAAEADLAWREGLKKIYRQSRVLMPDALILENDGPLYAGEVNGLQFENFPNGGWSAVIARVIRAAGQTLAPGLVIINANTANSGSQNDFQKFRYGLASALLVDAYYGFDYGDLNHGQTWWYDEYEARLGAPGAAPSRIDGGGSAGWRAGVWRRDYGLGAVVVNSGPAAKTVDLGADFERLHGTQDSSKNNGSIGRTVDLAPADGIVLLKPLGEVRGAAFQNGSFVRVFDSGGRAVRTGFFVTAERFSQQATLLTRVTDGENREVFAAEGPRIRVFSDGYKQTAVFAPFGDNFKGTLSLAVGDLRGDGSGRLAVAGADAGGGVVKIFDLTGRLEREFRAFGEGYKGGASLAAADLDGDGKAEIAVGAGPGGGPHVRIFRGDGSLYSSGFFAFEPKFRGGVTVAAGDVNGDGKAEIAVGAGPGGGPHVRIFNAKGKLVGQFFAYDQSNRGGVTVGIADIARDGKQDILAFSKNPVGALRAP